METSLLCNSPIAVSAGARRFCCTPQLSIAHSDDRKSRSQNLRRAGDDLIAARNHVISFRYLETGEYLGDAPAHIPAQSRSRMCGFDLADAVLRNFCHYNAARLRGLTE